MKTKDEIVALMLSEMPYKLDAHVVPYLLEMVELTQKEAYNQGIIDVFNKVGDIAELILKLKK